jgi:hypothetical protein
MRKSFARSLRRRRRLGDRSQWRVLAPLLVATVVGAGRADSQVVPGAGSSIGTLAADRARVRQITGRITDSAVSADSLPSISPLYPAVRLVSNSDLPSGGNDGALWAGRGLSGSITGGVTYRRALEFGRLEVALSPEFTFSANRSFFVFGGREPGRSAFSSPWHIGQSSADLPLRFGDVPLRAIGLGQSSVTLTLPRVAFGLSSTNEWWGPAIRNTLLLGNNAAGVPRLFVRTARPLHTRYGSFEGRAMIGALTESPFFDYDKSNDTRSLSGLLVTYRPALDTGLTLGLSRLVMARASSNFGVVQHALDVVLRYEPIVRESDTTASGASGQRTDQLFSLFARWVFPASGFETYAEWSRMELPRSIREYLEVPQSTQGYTLGLQWADPHAANGFLRLQGEVTDLEQTQVLPDRPPPDYYTGRAVVQGFTQRGQVLGAAIGPGSSSQFLAADWMEARWQAGFFVGRIRTENDALYRLPFALNTQHDVTIYSGVRGGVILPRTDVSWELTVGRRMNYLFQSDYYLSEPVVAFDVQNITLSFLVSPR